LWNPQRNAICESCGEPLRAAPAGDIQPAAPQAGAATLAAIPGVVPGVVAPAMPEAPPSTAQTASDRPRVRRDEPSLYAPILGPADRESFFAAQRRHRRATWKLTASSAVAAILTGVPLSLILTPILFLAILILTRLLHIVVPVPDAVWDAYRDSGRVLVDVVEALDDPATPGVEEGDIGRVPKSLLLKAALIWFVPGVLFMLILWPTLIRLFRHGGVGGVLLSLGAREPNLNDLEERQLVNVIEEMALAAGLPAPRVMLLDARVANAAAVGSSAEDATIVVSRPLLDDLNRDETQGVLAHLVASIGNGDLRAAMSIVAIFQTFGFASALVKAPISGPARTTVRRTLGYIFSRHKPHERAEEARVVSGMLTTGIWADEKDDLSWINEMPAPPAQRRGPKLRLLLYFPVFFVVVFAAGLLLEWPDDMRRLSLAGVVALALWIVWHQRDYARHQFVYAAKMTRAMIMLPYYIGAMMPQIMLGILTSFILEPMLAFLWRTRRYLADATAVQLTRQPDGLARGLAGLVERGGLIPGGKWAGPLFVVGPEAASARVSRAIFDRQQKHLADARTAVAQDDPKAERGIIDETRAYIEAQRRMAADAQATQRAAGEPVAPVAPGLLAFGHATAQAYEASGATQHAGFTASGDSGVVSFHPPLGKRMKKLRQMGSSVAEVDLSPQAMMKAAGGPSRWTPLGVLVFAVFAFLMALCAVLMVVALVLMGALALGACAILMAIVYGLFELIAPV
jgi:Zn-dependent protease with chaperone function